MGSYIDHNVHTLGLKNMNTPSERNYFQWGMKFSRLSVRKARGGKS